MLTGCIVPEILPAVNSATIQVLAANEPAGTFNSSHSSAAGDPQEIAAAAQELGPA